jgi:predicted alpha/beta-hydrolase family hydrolase
MPPRRATTATSGTVDKKDKTKATTPSVLRFFGGAAPAKPPTDPVLAVFEISSASGKPIRCERYTPRSVPDSESKDGAATSEPTTSTTTTLIFTHGAGGGISNAATTCFAMGFASSAPTLVFEGAPNLVARTKAFQAVLQHALDVRPQNSGNDLIPVLGGRSLGARAAVQTANARNSGLDSTSPPLISALVLVSYPLTGPGGDMRDAILYDIHPGVDVLFVSGDRDGMCNLEQLNGVRKQMRARSWLAVVRGADHGMSSKPASTVEARRKTTGVLAARWFASRDRDRTECVLAGTEVEEWKAAESGDTGGRKGKRRGEEPREEETTKKKAKKA